MIIHEDLNSNEYNVPSRLQQDSLTWEPGSYKYNGVSMMPQASTLTAKYPRATGSSSHVQRMIPLLRILGTSHEGRKGFVCANRFFHISIFEVASLYYLLMPRSHEKFLDDHLSIENLDVGLINSHPSLTLYL